MESPQILSSKTYMNLEDLEHQSEEEHSTSVTIHQSTTKPQLFFYGFCTGLAFQLVLLGCADLFLGKTYLGRGITTSSRDARVSSSPLEQLVTECIIFVVSVTSSLGVFYIFSFMPIFRQPGRMIRIRNAPDDDEAGSVCQRSWLWKDVRNNAQSFLRRLSGIGTLFSLGYLTGGYFFFLVTDLEIGTLSAIGLHSGLYFTAVTIILCLLQTNTDNAADEY